MKFTNDEIKGFQPLKEFIYQEETVDQAAITTVLNNIDFNRNIRSDNQLQGLGNLVKTLIIQKDNRYKELFKNLYIHFRGNEYTYLKELIADIADYDQHIAIELLDQFSNKEQTLFATYSFFDLLNINQDKAIEKANSLNKFKINRFVAQFRVYNDECNELLEVLKSFSNIDFVKKMTSAIFVNIAGSSGNSDIYQIYKAYKACYNIPLFDLSENIELMKSRFDRDRVASALPKSVIRMLESNIIDYDFVNLILPLIKYDDMHEIVGLIEHIKDNDKITNFNKLAIDKTLINCYSKNSPSYFIEYMSRYVIDKKSAIEHIQKEHDSHIIEIMLDNLEIGQFSNLVGIVGIENISENDKNRILEHAYSLNEDIGIFDKLYLICDQNTKHQNNIVSALVLNYLYFLNCSTSVRIRNPFRRTEGLFLNHDLQPFKIIRKLFPERKEELRQLLRESYTDDFDPMKLYQRFATFLYPNVDLDYEHINKMLSSLGIDKSINFFKTLSLSPEKDAIFIDFQM